MFNGYFGFEFFSNILLCLDRQSQIISSWYILKLIWLMETFKFPRKKQTKKDEMKMNRLFALKKKENKLVFATKGMNILIKN